jgi:hypothetical protein
LIDSRTTPTLSKASRHSSPAGSSSRAAPSPHHALVDLERVRGGQELDAHARGLEPDEAQVGRVGLGAQLDAADVADPHQRGALAALARLDHDVLELLGLGQPAAHAHAQVVGLVLVGGRVAERPGRDLQVLLAQRRHHVAGGDLARRQPRGVEPDAHRVLALAEDDDIADARHALDRVAHVGVEVVAHELRAVAVVLRVEAEAAQEARGVLEHRDARCCAPRRAAGPSPG